MAALICLQCITVGAVSLPLSPSLTFMLAAVFPDQGQASNVGTNTEDAVTVAGHREKRAAVAWLL